ncbi:Lrp/AsnC family transcriptional regulator [Parendozoicomonas haliclonae]|uniref:Leucine-responsive regulatory protein n=1 Tax=Parendozoicomonas haliclonae TaxID=1960125 RepID=A0A1X7AJK7_9GAMM|nr:Lrp/AsnC family transcriptional regulator [Parendozoicomonas haliclonae]SMA45681.1 Leucine-responsive regulatory protein [Parendozoicomonas haliclonae]
MKLDRHDLRILDELQKNARITNQDLADKIGLSPSPCLRRVKALEESGIIIDQVSRLNPSALGLKLCAFVHISLDRHTPERFESFERQVLNYPEVMECHLIAGQSADYMLKVIVPDMEHYHEFLITKITPLEGVTGAHSSFVLRNPVNRTALPLPIQ